MALNRLMHPDNIYKSKQPNFLDLAMKWPNFANFVSMDVTNHPKLDYSNPEALRQLTMVLLKEDFDLTVNLPPDRLVPTLPLRVNYLLWLGDIFGKKQDLYGLDIGAGASCIYPLIGKKMFHWRFLAIESDDINYEYACKNVIANDKADAIQVVKVNNETDFANFVNEHHDAKFDFCLCNPPFYSSPDEHNKSRTARRPKPQGVNTANIVESVTPGGEVEFVKKVIVGSFQLRDKIRVYTTMLGKKSSLSPLRKMLIEAGVPRIGHTEFCQGRTMRWGLGWSFDTSVHFPKSTLEQYHATRVTPLRLPLTASTSTLSTFSIEELQNSVIQQLTDLGENSLELVRSASNCRVFVFKATAPNWANQRGKRRAAARLAKCADTAAAALSAEPDNHDSNSNSNGEKMKEDGSNLMQEGSNGAVSTLKRPHDEEHWMHAEGWRAEEEEEDVEVKKLRRDLENETNGEGAENGGTVSPSDGKKAILKCYLTLKLLPDKSLLLELNFIAGDNKELMHQVYQFLKNKLVRTPNQSNDPQHEVASAGEIAQK